MDNIKQAIQAFKKGEMIIVTDDENRENEGDLILAAEKATPEKIAFMVRYTSGVITMPMEGERLDALQLPMMVSENTELHRTAFTISVDHKDTTTGISAKDRSSTIRALTDPKTKPKDLRRPGHIFPLRAVEGGILKRAGHTEAAVDLAKLAGLSAAGVICEIVNDDGTMMRLPDLQKFAKKHTLRLITIQDLIEYRRHHEKLIELTAKTTLPTSYGVFEMIVYRSKVDDHEHVALVVGNISKEKYVLTRVHSECLTGDLFHSERCDCGRQLENAIKTIQKKGVGVLLYMRHEGRGIGLGNKIKAYALQDEGLDTVEANEKLGFPTDLRNYGIGAQILKELGVKEIDLLTNNPQKIIGLEGHGLKIHKRIPLETKPHAKNRKYLCTKKNKMGHLLENV
ncbi:bifunctional 3,4-dihydroxy-2-butanone-4-phosphate synthase/GTP cyclohydrolase II [Candidatus Peregrinibacteria bacterium CG_4_10_14_0_2_um_filter_43_11]|nr:MAG: bifunctional 3,4-dihydroxy-2-butanone-4-phosphate synthase/GTP cyclohydrolase II [Candidatus Peregrinibacteria bacterium CG_4_10_14_0_2_um_filter_43_11]